jgi:hypothetical protein
MVPKSVLDQPVFERMEGDDDRSAALAKTARQHGRKEVVEVFELVVGGDSQGLKHARGGMGLRPATRVNRFADRLDQVGGSPNGTRCAPGDDCSGDVAAESFLAVFEEDVSQLGLIEGREELGRRNSTARVKAHVERAAGLEAEAAAGVGQLIGRKAQVEQDAVDLVDVQFVEDGRHLDITGVPQDAAGIGQGLGSPGDHHGIAIETDEFVVSTEMGKDDATVAAGADRAIDDDKPRTRIKELNDFPYEDGLVNGRALAFRGPRWIRHGMTCRK